MKFSYFLSRAILPLKRQALRGATQRVGLRWRYAMSLSPKRAELLLRIVKFFIFRCYILDVLLFLRF